MKLLPLRNFLIGVGAMMLVLTTVVSPLGIESAQAQIPVTETNIPGVITPLALISASAGATAANTTIQTNIMSILNGIAWAVAKAMIQTMTKSIVNWINSGFQGSPGFVTNLNFTLLSVANAAADSFIQQLATNGAIRSPFQTVVASALQNNYNQHANGGFFAANQYTLNQVTQNDAAFLAGNFSQGGLNAWMSAISNPSNNPYGAYILAKNALTGVTSNARGTQQTELNWGRGIFSSRGSCGATAASANSPTRPPTSLSTNNNCLAYNIQTPGSLIEGQLETTFGSPIRQLELANSINEIVGALATQLVSQVFGGSGLFGASQANASNNYIAPINAITSPTAYASSTESASGGFAATISNQQAQLAQYQGQWQTIQSLAQSTQAALQGSTCYPNAQNALTTVVGPALAQASAALSNASAAQTALAQIQSDSLAAQNALPANQVAASGAVASEYQAYLSSPTIPGPNDFANAQFQSTDSGSSTPQSLFTELTQLTQAAQSCQLPSGTTEPVQSSPQISQSPGSNQL